MRATAVAASISACLILAAAAPAASYTTHPAIALRGSNIYFYAGHLVLDASGHATLDDGVVHVLADRIVVDLTKNRYVAAGNVTVARAMPPAGAPIAAVSGAALGASLTTHEGTLVVIDPAPASFPMSGAAIVAVASPAPSGAEPLALADLEGELPYARAGAATAHLGADVRLGGARVIVPGGKDVYLPSYVYTFSSDAGYSQSNVASSSEDIPIYFGSTRDSVSGAHFTYNATTKLGLGLDHRIVDGEKAYALFSVSPVNGPRKNANFTWQEQINGHASQNVNASTSTGIGSFWNYSVIDSVHRSYLTLNASSAHQFNAQTLAWQGAYEPLGAGWLGKLFNFHLESDYGRSQTYGAADKPSYATSFESVIQAPYLALNPSSSLSLQGDWRQSFINTPERQFTATYTTVLQHQWNPHVTTGLTDREISSVFVFPSFDDGSRVYESQLAGTIAYSNGEPFGFRLDLTHSAAHSAPPGIVVQPWFASFDVRFRVSSSLAFDISRSYGFGFNGQRFGSLGFQILP